MYKLSRLALSLCSALVLAVGFYSQVSAQAPIACPGFKTWTQGGYGASSNGQPVQFLNANFSTAFSSGLTIGCAATNKTIKLTSASAVRNFLPQGTAPSYITSALTNPTKTNFNSVLAGQLVTLTLNVKFDQTFASFGSSSTNLKDLVITTGTFMGLTVQEFLDDANKKIGGCSTVKNTTYSDYNNTADKINRAYDNGVSAGNFLACPMTVSCSSTNAVCFDSFTGSMTVNVAGGIPPYSIVSWSNSASGSFNGTLSATASNLHAGTYTAVIADLSGKQLSTTCTVSEPPMLVATPTQTNVSCHGLTDGTVTITATGGTPPYSGTGNFTGLGAGTYNYTVTDANGCTSEVSVTITQPEKLAVSGTTEESSACTPDPCDGYASVNVEGGTTPYSYAWTVNGSEVAGSESVLENLCGGVNANVDVTDANGCKIDYDFSITCKPNTCDPLRTYTMGGWGAPTPNCSETVNSFTVKNGKQSIGDVTEPNGVSPSETIGGGNSPAVQYLYANFAGAFPYGLSIGCTNKVIFNSACAITKFLPSGGPSNVLTGGVVYNPTNLKNTLAGQICAATLSMVFDSYDADYTASAGTLADRFVQSGPLAGKKVSEVIEEANNKIGGCSSPYSLADLNVALTAINENYDNGDGTDQGFLGCAAPSGRMATVFGGDLFPNPAGESSAVKVEAKSGESLNIVVADFMGRILFESNSTTVQGMNEVKLPLSGITAKQCIVRVTKGAESFTKVLYISK